MVTIKIAFRNIFLHKLKTTIIGLILVFGTVLAIMGNAFVDAITKGMQRSLTNSVTGHIQIYSSKAKDKLAVFGSIDGSLSDIGYVNDFKKVRDVLMKNVDNIKSIIPLGLNYAMVSPGNLLDIKIEELRQSYKKKSEGDQKASEQILALTDHIRKIIEEVKYDFETNGDRITILQDEMFKQAPDNLKKALSDEFWSDFSSKYEEKCEFLGNKIAPLIFDENFLYFAYMGTVPKKFQEGLPLFEIVKGEQIPPGKRGFLFNDFVYETMVKHRVAKRLDAIKKDIEKNRKKIKGTKTLEDSVKANTKQAAEIYNQLDGVQTNILIPKLQKLISSNDTSIRALLEKYLDMNDDNFMTRYNFFYEHIAPHILLYKVKIGETFPVNAFTKSGYSASLNMKVYGTFKFKGFEESPLSGNFCLIDMISFHDLYGILTPEKKSEVDDLEKEMGLEEFSSNDVNAMFSRSKPLEKIKEQDSSISTASMPTEKNRFEERQKIFEKVYAEDQMENGAFLNAAIILHNPNKISRTLKEINEIAKKENLEIQAVDWRESAGIIGQLITVIRGVLYAFVFIIFLVAAFIMMNSLFMATMERKREIGTMRAIGAQKRFVLHLFLNEMLLLNGLFGFIGIIISSILILIIGHYGIPGQGDVATFFFSGPRLYLTFNPIHIAIVFVVITVVAILSTQFPAWRALKISPLEAMQKND